jgi:hypothetical protein
MSPKVLNAAEGAQRDFLFHFHVGWTFRGKESVSLPTFSITH